MPARTGVRHAEPAVVMTIHKLTAGDGYTYLTRHIAGGDVDRERGQDAASYYTAEGNPPGRWLGAGVVALGVDPTSVTETQMRALYGLGLHPDADRIIADYQAAHIRAGMSEPQRTEVMSRARRRAALGRQFPVYQALAPYEERVERRLAVIAEDMGRPATTAEIGKIRREESARQRAAVAGYDAVFAPVKSAALLWALDERDWVRTAVRAAHEDARDAALEMLEHHAAYTRTGKAGVAQIDTRGLVAVAFDHYDSRDGDPNLHTHLVIANKIQGVDGKWRSLDGRALYQLTVAASEHYNTAFETALTARLGVRFTPRPGSTAGTEPVREIDGVPTAWIRHFSRRRTELEARYDDLLHEYRQTHGHDPTRKAAHQLARQANLDTRAGKKPPRSLHAMRADWRAQITDTFGPGALHTLHGVATTPPPVALRPTGAPRPARPTDEDVHQLAAVVIGRVAEQRATWTRWNVHAEAERALRDWTTRAGPLSTIAAQRAAVASIVERALSPAHSIVVDAPPVLDEPAVLRRADGTSMFTEHAATRYTSQAILDAEQRLLHAATTPAVLGLNGASVAAALDAFEARHRRQLDSGQRDLVTAFATATTRLTAGIGAAGTGKTTAMRALRHVVDAHHRRLIPLATSAASAAVLAADIDTPTENLHKFLWEHTPGCGVHADTLHYGRAVPASHHFFTVQPGDVILVDEAGMAGTLLLDRLLRIAAHHGATVRLLGDWRQLGAVESGGALRLIAHDAGAVELTTLHRFTNPAEATATVRLRTGDITSLDFHQAHARIVGGSRQAMTDTIYAAWHADMRAGHTTLMIAATNRDISQLSARARTDRIAAGHVEPDGVQLRDGTVAGRGDWIVTRANDRTTVTHRGKDWVKNGDAWTVLRRHGDGSLRVQHQNHGGRVTLAADYIAAHVQLHYATTVHRALGATVDTAHLLVDDHLTREHLYVALTRGRHRNHAYVATHELLPLDEDHRLDRPRHDPDARAAREVLDAIVARDDAPRSATETIRDAQDATVSLATLAPRYLHAAEHAASTTYRRVIREMLDPTSADQITTDAAFPALVRALRHGVAIGWQPEQLLVRAVSWGPLSAAESPARLLAWRCAAIAEEHPVPAPLAQPDLADVRRYADVVAALTRLRPDQLDAAAALARPTTVTIRTEGPSVRQPDHYQSIIAGVLGSRATVQAAAEPGWPALGAALRRADRAGHEPAQVLRRAAAQRELHSANSLSEVLAWRINRYLHRHPAPAEPDLARTWNRLAWTLKGYEQTGGRNAEEILSAAAGPAQLDRLLDHVDALSRHANARRRQAEPLPPWLANADTATIDELTAYVAAARSQISDRIHHLAIDAATHRPAWTTVFGDSPHDEASRQRWLRQLGIAAAYRDQHQVTDDAAEQPLGPYIAAGRAGHTAYWHAANAVITAYSLTQPGNAGAAPNPVEGQVAADVYTHLPPDERAQIAAQLATKLGPLWLGSTADAQATVTQPIHAQDLAEVLRERGHLTSNRTPSPVSVANQPPADTPDARTSIAREAERLAELARQSRQRQTPQSRPASASGPPNQPDLLPPPPAQPNSQAPTPRL